MPTSLVTKVFVSPVSMFVRVTLAPGTAAPAAVTVPRISPVFLLCANAGETRERMKGSATTQRMKRIMEFLLSRNSAVFRDGLLLNFAISLHLGAASRESGRINLSRSRSNFPNTDSAAEDLAFLLTLK